MNEEIKRFDSFRKDDDGVFFYYDTEIEKDLWSYELDKLEDYITNLQQENERLQQENFNLRENIHIEKISLPKELTKDKSFMEIYDIPSYEDLKKENERLKEAVDREVQENELIRCDIHNSYSILNGRTKDLLDYKSRNEKAIEYMKNYIEVEELNEPVKIEFEEVINILERDDNNE